MIIDVGSIKVTTERQYGGFGFGFAWLNDDELYQALYIMFAVWTADVLFYRSNRERGAAI